MKISRPYILLAPGNIKEIVNSLFFYDAGYLRENYLVGGVN
jgi:hypothetical protein